LDFFLDPKQEDILKRTLNMYVLGVLSGIDVDCRCKTENYVDMGFSKCDDDHSLCLELKDALAMMTLHPANFFVVSLKSNQLRIQIDI
jgi:hypothetical protein